jgi:hypothetical protein
LTIAITEETGKKKPLSMEKKAKIKKTQAKLNEQLVKFNVGADTYAMAFRALHRDSAVKMEL